MFRADVKGNIGLREAEQNATFLALFCDEFADDILKFSLPLVKSRSGFMIARSQNQVASVQELVERFVSIGLAQYDALYVVDTTKYNRLYAMMVDIRNELKHREGDQRHELLPLLDHPNVQVRLKAAITMLAVAPGLARAALESVRDSGILPQSADAEEMLEAVDDGSYVPI